MNQKSLATGATWSPNDSNGGKSTWNGDPATVPAGGVGYQMNGIEVPDGYLMVLHALRMFIGDPWEVNFSPGEYTEHFIYKGDDGLGYGDSDWVNRTTDSDFLCHFAAGYNGIEDTASGTGGAAYVMDPPSLLWEPPMPVLSATGDFSEAWEGDQLGTGGNNGEWTIVAYYDLMEADRTDIIDELLGER